MASIKISNLYPAGSELFKDSESFMTELVDNELGSINGGIGITYNSPLCHPTVNSPWCKPSLPRPIATTLPPAL
jgi:hypothetical protein